MMNFQLTEQDIRTNNFSHSHFEDAMRSVVLSKDFLREASSQMTDNNKKSIEVWIFIQSLSDFNTCSQTVRRNIMNMIYGGWEFADKNLEKDLMKYYER